MIAIARKIFAPGTKRHRTEAYTTPQYVTALHLNYVMYDCNGREKISAPDASVLIWTQHEYTLADCAALEVLQIIYHKFLKMSTIPFGAAQGILLSIYFLESKIKWRPEINQNALHACSAAKNSTQQRLSKLHHTVRNKKRRILMIAMVPCKSSGPDTGQDRTILYPTLPDATPRDNTGIKQIDNCNWRE
jgi:hypothetical protein